MIITKGRSMNGTSPITELVMELNNYMYIWFWTNLGPFLILQFPSYCKSTPMAVKIIKVSYNFMITLRSVGPYFLALQSAEPGQARIIILYLLYVFIQRYAIQTESDKIITAWLNKVRTTASSDHIGNLAQIQESSMIKIGSKLSLSLGYFWLKFYFSCVNFEWKNSNYRRLWCKKQSVISGIHSLALSAVLNYE